MTDQLNLLDNPSNRDFTLLEAATVNIPITSPEIITETKSGIVVIIEVTAIDVGAIYQPFLRGIDPASGKTYQIVIGPGITAVGTYVLMAGSGIAQPVDSVIAGVTVTEGLHLPRRSNVFINRTLPGNITYSVGVSLVSS